MTDQLAPQSGDFTRVPNGEGGVAWDDPGTRRAWWRQTGRSVLVVAVCAGWWSWWSGATEAAMGRVVPLTVAFFLYSFCAPRERSLVRGPGSRGS